MKELKIIKPDYIIYGKYKEELFHIYKKGENYFEIKYAKWGICCDKCSSANTLSKAIRKARLLRRVWVDCENYMRY